jgi:hypothetical protein
VDGGHVVSELFFVGYIVLSYSAVDTQFTQLFVYLAVHRKMGGLAQDF